jgi:hypothetical protein
MTRSDGRPAWLAQVQAWVNAKLDEQDAAFHRKLVNGAKNYTLVLNERASRLDDDEKARRKHRGLAKTQKWLKELALQQAEQGNIEPLQKQVQKQDARLARFVNLPQLKRGEHFEKPPHPAYDRLEQALAELPSVRFLLKFCYEKTSCPKGQLTAEQILADRWDLDETEMRKRRISRARLKRERASSDK